LPALNYPDSSLHLNDFLTIQHHAPEKNNQHPKQHSANTRNGINDNSSITSRSCTLNRCKGSSSYNIAGTAVALIAASGTLMFFPGIVMAPVMWALGWGSTGVRSGMSLPHFINTS